MAGNSRFAVATHILVALAHLPEQLGLDNRVVRSEIIGGSVNTHPVVIRKIVARLVKAGLVISHAGKGGGLELARRPEKITLADVYRAMDEEPVFVFKENKPNPACPVGSSIVRVLSPVFDDVEKRIETHLHRTTVRDLVQKL